MKRKCLVKRLYEIATPYVQLIGWAVVVASIFVAAMTTFNTVEAFDGRLTTLERIAIDTDKNLAEMNGKLDVLIERQ